MQKEIFDPISAEILYKNHLNIIRNTRFSLREVDVIACIMNNRGEKKIAGVLSLSPRTVSSHVRNIMIKISCNSKEAIIDFIESSGKTEFFRFYYQYLLRIFRFEKLLADNRELFAQTTFIINNKSENFSKILVKHLEIAGQKVATMQASVQNTVTLDFDQFKEKGYFETIFEHLKNLDSSKKFSVETEKFIESLSKAGTEKGSINFDSHNKKTFQENVRKNFPYLVIISFITIYSFNKFIFLSPNINRKLQTVIVELSDEELSSDYTNIPSSQRNVAIIEKFIKFLDDDSLNEVDRLFKANKLSGNLLLKYVHNINSLAAFYRHIINDNIFARKLLLHGKSLMEYYANRFSATNINFVALSPDEIIAELKVMKHLPEIYSRILYSLGRTYIYSNSYDESEKYLFVAKEIARNLNLFEAYLADISGYTIERERLTGFDITNKEYIRIKLEELARKYFVLMNSDIHYISDYNPSTIQQKVIIPSRNIYNKLLCATKILEIYNDLLKLEDSPAQLNNILVQIEQTVNLDLNVIINEAEKSNISQNRLAILYNILAGIMLTLYEKKLSCATISEQISKLLLQDYYLSNNNNLCYALTEQLFIKSKSLSSNNDFSKADAYYGLAKLYEKKYEDKSLP